MAFKRMTKIWYSKNERLSAQNPKPVQPGKPNLQLMIKRETQPTEDGEQRSRGMHPILHEMEKKYSTAYSFRPLPISTISLIPSLRNLSSSARSTPSLLEGVFTSCSSENSQSRPMTSPLKLLTNTEVTTFTIIISHSSLCTLNIEHSSPYISPPCHLLVHCFLKIRPLPLVLTGTTKNTARIPVPGVRHFSPMTGICTRLFVPTCFPEKIMHCSKHATVLLQNFIRLA